MSQVLEKTKSIEKKIAVKLSFKDYDGAIKDCDEGIIILKAELDSVEEIYKKNPNNSLIEYRNSLAANLSNFYGMKGGSLRRKGSDFLPEAISMYEEGYRIESNNKYNIQNSYNLVNRIAQQIVLKPENLFTMKEKLMEGIELINKQVQGVRRDEWWAWADIGQLYLLSGESEKARGAYKKFINKRPLKKNYKSVISVLTDLKNALSKNNSPIADYINTEIEFLEQNMP